MIILSWQHEDVTGFLFYHSNVANLTVANFLLPEAEKRGLNVKDPGGRPPPRHSIDRSQEVWILI